MPAGGASSFHLWWRLVRPGGALLLSEVSAVVEILVPPTVPALYFWALQVDFVGTGGVWGSAHTGLQWNRRYPGNTAVNWGGYASPERGGGVLEGGRSPLPGFADDPHTLAYTWSPGRAYRLRVFRPEGGAEDGAGLETAWRAEVTDMETGVAQVVRDLFPERGVSPRQGALRRALSSGGRRGVGSGSARFLGRPVVWSEVFAECDDPSVVVRWSRLEARDERGALVPPEAVVAGYQAEADGGCANTDSRLDGEGGVLQCTNTLRTTAPGSLLRL